jgi:hypothetical protein
VQKYHLRQGNLVLALAQNVKPVGGGACNLEMLVKIVEVRLITLVLALAVRLITTTLRMVVISHCLLVSAALVLGWRLLLHKQQRWC